MYHIQEKVSVIKKVFIPYGIKPVTRANFEVLVIRKRTRKKKQLKNIGYIQDTNELYKFKAKRWEVSTNIAKRVIAMKETIEKRSK